MPDRKRSSSGRRAALSAFHEEAMRRTAPSFDNPTLTRVRAETTPEVVAQGLRRRIINRELADGEALPPEAILSEAFGVSRPTLREAFRVLESENLITVRRGARGGAQVHAPDEAVAARYIGFVLEHRGATLADVFDAREMLERLAVESLLKGATRADLRTLWLRHEELGAQIPADAAMFSRNSLTFHRLLVALARNETLTALVAIVTTLIDRAQARYWSGRPPALKEEVEGAHREHAQMLDMLEARDEATVELWRRHCRTHGGNVLSRYGKTTVLELLTARPT